MYIEELSDDNLTIWGNIRDFKGIKIYPIKMKNILRFYRVVQTLTIDKNSTPDIDVIRMSYLDFLLKKVGQTQQEVYIGFIQLLKLVLREQIFDFRENKTTKELEIVILKTNDETLENYKELDKQKQSLLIEQNNIFQYARQLEEQKMVTKDIENELIEKITSVKTNIEEIDIQISNLENEIGFVSINGRDEFNEFKKVILKENGIKDEDEYLSPEIRQELKKAQDFINKHNKTKQATIEEQITAYHTAIGINYDEIKELTIYQFTKGLQRKAHQVNFEVLGSAMASGMVSFKGDPPNWLEHIPEKGQYEDITMTEDEFNNGIRKDLEK